MKNVKVRIALLEANKRLYWLAELLGISEATLTRKMRVEMPDDEQSRIVEMIRKGAE